MTMIAFATYGDRAEFITDSASYLANGAGLSHCTKAVPLPHLDMAVLAQGDSVFAVDAKTIVMQVAGQVSTFDGVVRSTPEHLRTHWALRLEEYADAKPAKVFLLGYSQDDERFTAWELASDVGDFEPLRIDQPYVLPCPWGVRPDERQAERLHEWDREQAAKWGVEPLGDRIVERWLSRPAMAAPASIEEWVTVAKVVRKERTDEYASVIVAGDVFHTRIGRGEVTTQRIHSYDDSFQSEDFQAMVAGTQHPLGQLLPCICGSGTRALECHLADQLDEICGCLRSGKTFRECCAVDA